MIPTQMITARVSDEAASYVAAFLECCAREANETDRSYLQQISDALYAITNDTDAILIG